MAPATARKIRVVVAKPGLEGHDRGAKIIARALRDAGTAVPQGLYDELLRLIEPALLEDVMRRLKGNRWVAAQWLGLNRATVRKKLALYGLHQNQAAADDESENGDDSA